jgi:hypothetical protein
MKYFDVSFHGRGRTVNQGWFIRMGGLLASAALLILPLISHATGQPGGSAITQLEYIQWLAQVTGEASSLGSIPSAADLIQWAQSKGMSPNGGWKPGAVLTKEVLAQTLVQLFNLNPKKYGGDFEKNLLREGIVLPSQAEISRVGLINVVDEFGFQSRTLDVARSSKSPVRGNNGVGNGEDPPPPGWVKNHPDRPQNDGPGTGPGNPGNKGGANKNKR